MTLQSQMVTDAAGNYSTDEFGVSVSYTPSGGEASTIVIIPEDYKDNQEDHVRGDEMAVMAAWVQKADVANPGYGDKFVRDGKTWLFSSAAGGVVEENPAESLCMFVRNETG